jgi:GrpB-like predicted nucleotidyltransferase (UPF0157 family)
MASDKSWQRVASIRVVPYDESWPRVFEKERIILERLLARWLVGPVEHVGSTAVPGLAAKPVIDIMAGVQDLEESRPAIPTLSTRGYVYTPFQAEEKHWFYKPSTVPSTAFHTHHLYLVPFGNRHWHERLAFRDFLRRDSITAREYAELKQWLAEQFEFDRKAYTEAKKPFIQRILKLAL